MIPLAVEKIQSIEDPGAKLHNSVEISEIDDAPAPGGFLTSSSLWYLPLGTGGDLTADVEVTFTGTGASNMSVAATSYFGVNQTTPVDGAVSADIGFVFILPHNLSLAVASEPGDRVVIGINGVFGGRMRDICERCGAVVEAVESPWGEMIDPSRLIDAAASEPTKAVAVVHAETSTGENSQ